MNRTEYNNYRSTRKTLNHFENADEMARYGSQYTIALTAEPVEELNIVKLDPNDSRKSFYGKAVVCQKNGIFVLVSYQTPVMDYDSATRKIRRLWAGYSATTQRHINAFLALVGRSEYAGKANTQKMKVMEEY